MGSEQPKELTDEKPEPWIYLDLSQSVAIVRSAPAAASVVDEDVELKNYVDFFLGVQRRQRYSAPQLNGDSEEQGTSSEESSEEPARKQRRLTASFVNIQLSPQNLVSLTHRMAEELPPELSGLPDKRQRERLCRAHKELVEKILEQEQSLHCLSFVESLNVDLPAEACHPLAIDYRQRFSTCKVELAQILFKLLNHTIFYCGLRQYLAWQPLNGCNSDSILCIGSNGNRSVRYRLSTRINDPNVLLHTLVHEMCHAAAFVFNGETAHGDSTRKWAYRAKLLLPQLPRVAHCAPSFSYYCRLCRRRASSNLRLHVKNYLLRCFYCQFELHLADVSELLPVLPETHFTLFVRAHYQQCDLTGHSAKMRALNAKFLGVAKAN